MSFPRKTVIALTLQTAIVVAAVLAAGCDPQQGRLLERHMADSPHSDAQKRWHDVRSGMKVQLAEEHLNCGRMEEAEEALEHAIALSPRNVHGYLLATRLRLIQGRLAEAREMVRLAAAIPSDDPDIDYYSGVIAERYGERETALEHYTAAAMKAPNDEKALVAQTRTLASLGRTVDAMELILSREADFEDSEAVHLLAARVCQRLGLRGSALEQCHKVMRVSPDDKDLAIEMGMLLAWAEQYDESIAVLRPLVDAAVIAESPLSPRRLDASGSIRPIVVHVLANAYLATEQWDAARNVLGFVKPNEHHDTLTQSLFARSALLAGNLTQAADFVETLHQKGSGTAETWLLAAYIAYEQGNREAARRAVLKSLKQDEDLEPAQWLLARVSGQTSYPIVSEKHTATSAVSGSGKVGFGSDSGSDSDSNSGSDSDFGPDSDRDIGLVIDRSEETGSAKGPAFNVLSPWRESQSFLAEAPTGGS